MQCSASCVLRGQTHQMIPGFHFVLGGSLLETTVLPIPGWQLSPSNSPLSLPFVSSMVWIQSNFFLRCASSCWWHHETGWRLFVSGDLVRVRNSVFYICTWPGIFLGFGRCRSADFSSPGFLCRTSCHSCHVCSSGSGSLRAASRPLCSEISQRLPACGSSFVEDAFTAKSLSSFHCQTFYLFHYFFPSVFWILLLTFFAQCKTSSTLSSNWPMYFVFNFSRH